MRNIALCSLLLLCLMMAGCSSNQLLTDLQLVVDGVAAALPAIAGVVGMPAPTVALIESYLSQVNGAVDQASTILASSATAAQKAALIAAAFAGIIAPDLPAGTPQTVVNVVTAVIHDVLNFLGQITPANVAVAKGFTLSSGDTAKLQQIQGKTLVNRAKLMGMHR